ncbi:MAG: sensor histidine kinase, partial [Azovibrio sp.]|nr:sensor histidine kinase [Azovibrio sp.]
MKGPGWHILPGWHGLLLALFLVSLPAVGQAEGNPFPVDPVAGRQDFSRALTYLQDPDDQFSIDDMESVRERFSPLDGGTALPKGNAPLWLRLRLTNPGPQALTRWLSLGTPMLEHVEIYLLSPQQGSWDHQQGGTRVPRTKKPLRAPQPVFEIHLPPGESRLLLIHVSQAAWAALRQRSWAWLALLTFSLCVLLSAHAGLLASYAWPASWAFPALVPLLAQAGSLYALAGLSLNALPAGMFPQRGRQALGILQGLTTLALLAGAWQPILAQRMLLWLAPVLGIACLLNGLRVLHRGFAPARYLVLGLGVWCLLELLRQGAVSGILPIPGLAGMSWALGPLLVLPLLLLSLMARNHHLADQLIISHQQNEAQRDFLARVNHELRSPLNTIIGFARMLKRGSARLTTREGAEGIEQNGLRLLTMIDELLEESRLRSGRLELQPAPLPLRDWLEGLRRSWSVSTESKGNRFRLQIEGELPHCILIDGHRLRQVLDNLLSNANRHTHAGEVRLTLLVSLVKRRQQAKLEFLVSDTGEGIPPELLPLIFEPFVRGEQQGGLGGFGLGLPIARELLRRMDSDITVSSHLGEGSLFRFVLTCPVCPEAEPAPTGAAPCPPIQAEASLSPGTARILVVDDQAEDRLLLLDQLTRLGIQGV